MNAPAIPPLLRMANKAVRERAKHVIDMLPDGWLVSFSPPSMTPAQKNLFHAIATEFAKAIPEWHGVPMNKDRWKQLLIASFSKEMKGGKTDIVPDLSGSDFIQLRESISKMGKERGSALIEYCKAEAAQRGVPLGDDR